MKIKNKVIIGLFCFPLAAFSVCEAKDSSDPALSAAPSPYPVLDSGAWADWLNSPVMYWLDDQRVIFLGTETKDKPRNREKLQIQIWDILNNKITAYASTNGGIIGYNDGVIAYLYGKDSSGNNVFKCGKLNNEKVFTLVRKSKTYFDSINCRIQNSEEEPGRKERRTIRPLLKQHGYLDYGPRDAIRPVGKKGDPILFYPAEKKDPVSLPITNETTVIRMFDYYMFKDAYFVHHFTGYQDAWWMYPNGQTERVTFSELPKLLSQGKFFPIRNGFFVSRGSGKVDPGKDPGDAGGYLLRDTRILKLISGYLRAEAVSPDGCKIAFVNYPYIDATRLDDPARVALKAINFCMEEK